MKKYKAYLLLWLSAIAVSCSLDYPPESEVSDPDAIVSVASAEQALAAAYASYKPYGDAVMWAGRADDLLPSEYLSRDNSLYNTYMWDERELITQSENLWKSLYETVVKCNVLIERLPKVPANTRDDREQLQRIHQRASYLKALCYFDLLRIFSPAFGSNESAPYGVLIKNNFTITEQQKRLTQSESVEEIDRLLSIPAVEDKGGNIGGKTLETVPYYLTPTAAQTLRAALYLWAGNDQKALEIAIPLYEQLKATETAENLTKLWNTEKSDACLFAIDMRGESTSPYIALEYTGTNGFINDYLVVSNTTTATVLYADTDIRKGVYSIAHPTLSNVQLLGKYRKLAQEKKQMQYFTALRVAHLAFIVAEAYAHQGDNSAVTVVNTVLATRSATTISSSSTDREELLRIVLAEKQKEFVGESERFFDLKRNHLALKRQTTGSVRTIEATDYRFTLPIPASERRYNSAITQNKGWNVGSSQL